MLKMAKEANIGDPKINAELDRKIYETITEGFYEDISQTEQPVQQTEMTHPSVENADTLVAHLREMISEGYTDEQIKELHPEIAQLFNRGE